MVVFSGIGALAAGAFFGGSALAATLISTGLAVAAQTALSYVNRQKTKGPVAQEPTVAISSTALFGANTKDWVNVGLHATIGQRLYSASWGEGDQYRADVFKLSRGWCDGLEPEIIMFGERRTLTPATPINGEDERWIVDGSNDKLSIRFYCGKPGQVADARLVSVTAGSERPWRSTSRATNTCYAIFESDYDAEVLERGWPEVKYIIRGLRLYNWRKDSTVIGGAGTHRVDDPSTWEWTTNPAVIRANVEIGFKGVLSGRTIIGTSKTLGMLDLNSYTASANVSDVERTKNGRTFKTYQMGMAIQSGQDITEVLKDCDDAMAGYALNIGGLSGVIAGAPQVPGPEILPIDIRMDARQPSRIGRKTKDTYNHLTGSFMSPESLWELEPLDPVTSTADVASDKVDRSTNFDLPQINDVDCAQYNMTVRYRQLRLGAQESLPISQRLGLTIQAGGWYPFAGKTWMAMACDPEEGGYRLQISEVRADTYDEETIPAGPIIVPPSPVARSPVAPVSGFGIAADLDENESAGLGALLINAVWDAPGNPRIDRIIIQYRKVGTTVSEERSFINVGEGATTIRGLAAQTEYEARAAYGYDGFRQTAFTHPDSGPWERVTTDTPTVLVPDDSVSLAKLGLDVQSLFASYNRVQDQLEEIVAATNYSGSLEMLQRATEDGEIRAVVSRFGQETQALVLEESTARTNAIEALAAQSLLVQATLDEAEATGLMTLQSSVSGDGLTTSFGVLLRAKVGAAFQEAGLTFELTSDGGDPAAFSSAVRISADSLTLDDGVSPFTFTEGTLFIEEMRFRRLRSASGSIDIDGNNDRILVTTNTTP